MAKYLLLKHYRGAPAAVNDVPMDQWTPDEVSAHMQYMRDFATRLEGTGEYVDGQALLPEGTFVRYDGEGRPPVTDGPFAETKDLIAGWMVIDVESYAAGGRAGGRAVRCPGRRREADPRVARAAPVLRRAPHRHRVNESRLRELVPAVIGILVRRGADFAAAEDAVQEALVEARPPLARRPAAGPQGLAGHGGLAQVPRRDPCRHLPARAGRCASTRSRCRGRARRSTTRCGCTSCAPTRR